MARAGAPRPPELDQPPFPDEFSRFLPWLAALPCPIDWQALDAWQRSTHRQLHRWEIDLLMQLDRVRRT